MGSWTGSFDWDPFKTGNRSRTSKARKWRRFWVDPCAHCNQIGKEGRKEAIEILGGIIHSLTLGTFMGEWFDYLKEPLACLRDAYGQFICGNWIHFSEVTRAQQIYVAINTHVCCEPGFACIVSWKQKNTDLFSVLRNQLVFTELFRFSKEKRKEVGHLLTSLLEEDV